MTKKKDIFLKLCFQQNEKMSVRCKKDIFLSFYGCFFGKTKSQLDIFPFYRKDSIKKIKSLIREQYAAPPLDGSDI